MHCPKAQQSKNKQRQTRNHGTNKQRKVWGSHSIQTTIVSVEGLTDTTWAYQFTSYLEGQLPTYSSEKLRISIVQLPTKTPLFHILNYGY